MSKLKKSVTNKEKFFLKIFFSEIFILCKLLEMEWKLNKS